MIANAIQLKLENLVSRGQLAGKAADGPNRSWEGWLVESLHIVALVFPTGRSVYRDRIERLFGDPSLSTDARVIHIASILRGLLSDIQNGLITNLSNKITAEAFDNFLDHAEAYRVAGSKNEAGVIAGVVFEDTVRRVFREKTGHNDAGKSLEDLINALAKQQTISNQRSKQAKVAAHVRTKATHAQWGEFDLAGVEATIQLTKALLAEHLGA